MFLMKHLDTKVLVLITNDIRFFAVDNSSEKINMKRPVVCRVQSRPSSKSQKIQALNVCRVLNNLDQSQNKLHPDDFQWTVVYESHRWQGEGVVCLFLFLSTGLERPLYSLVLFIMARPSLYRRERLGAKIQLYFFSFPSSSSSTGFTILRREYLFICLVCCIYLIKSAATVMRPTVAVGQGHFTRNRLHSYLVLSRLV